ncbi:toprim domain-containing protein [Superficieibacter sp.]|uniref:toprim domain-containing protein n=1 Tax=Superficieibacter sp. TaxID=2303322 RepID=UPI0028B23544|nr:toprim domain-containing protein [Superficieibacter sp.]
MSALDDVKHWMKTNYAAACAAFSIPCEQSTKEHECPLCGKHKFRVRMTGATAGTYICTCGVKGCGFGVLDLIARKELGASLDERVSGSLIRQAAKLVDERMGLGFFSADDSYTPPTSEERAKREREQKEALAQRQRESAELEAQQIAAAAPRVRGVLEKTQPLECAYLKAKDFEDCVLPVTAKGDGVLRLTDIGNRDRSVQYLPAPNAVDNEGQLRHKSLMKNAPISGAFIDVQPNDKANTLIITEGYATARSVSICAPLPRVVAAISASNLKNVATAFRDRFPALEIVIAADNDYHAPSDVDANGKPKPNTGLVKANEAAKAVGGLVIAPLCLGRKKHDWDDVRMELGVERMTEEFNRELEKARKEKASGQEALSGTAQNNGANINPYPWDSKPSNVTTGESPANLPVASVPRIPAAVNIAKFRIPDHYKKYYSDKVPWQNLAQQCDCCASIRKMPGCLMSLKILIHLLLMRSAYVLKPSRTFMPIVLRRCLRCT